MSNITGLPKVPSKDGGEKRKIQSRKKVQRRPEKKKRKKLDRLPRPEKVQTSSAIAKPNIRICKLCGKEGRIVSNSVGVNVWCQCGNRWPISSTSMSPPFPETLPRGLSKQVLVEPNWDLAFQDVGETPNVKVGPKSRG